MSYDSLYGSFLTEIFYYVQQRQIHTNNNSQFSQESRRSTCPNIMHPYMIFLDIKY